MKILKTTFNIANITHVNLCNNASLAIHLVGKMLPIIFNYSTMKHAEDTYETLKAHMVYIEGCNED